MKQYAVIVEWDSERNRAYTLLKLDDNRKAYNAETIYVGQASQVELMRGWLSHVHDLKGEYEAIVYTNHVAVKYKRNHIADYDGIHARYNASYAGKYRVASQLAIEALKAEKGTD